MKAHIAAIEYALPDQCVTNDDLDHLHPNWSIHEVAKRTGGLARFICRKNETALDLATVACERLFERGEVAREEVGAIIVCTQSPDYVMPPNATLLQHRIRLPFSVAAFDYTLACSGFIYGLFMGKALIECQLLDNILLVTAETYSKYVHPSDRATMAVFGDGAAVTLLRGGPKGVGEFVLGTDGSGGDHFIIPAGGARIPRSRETCIEKVDASGNVRTLENIYMDGPAVLSFVKQQVPRCIRNLLSKTGYTFDDISLFVFHQASGLSLDCLETALAIPKEKMYRNLDRVGNTVSASIPIAIRDAQLEGLIVPGDRLLLAGFGVGYSWGACIVDW
ncbi:ketoacyl-ACP synthase III [Acidobacteria bacterium AH-259-D05]|nr:ketoacyl-ACP synthase III [Acidobacteria bacterium AH-259-D05]